MQSNSKIESKADIGWEVVDIGSWSAFCRFCNAIHHWKNMTAGWSYVALDDKNAVKEIILHAD